LVDAFARGEDIHARTAAEVFGIPQAQVTANQRRLAKVVNFGLFYGLSDFGLARDTGMSTEEARAFIDAYFRAYNRVREFLEVTPGERDQLIEVVPDLMARAYPLKVPVQVDLKLGPNWQDMERVRLVAARA